MDVERLLSLMDLKQHYDRMGLRDPADYEAAGFSPEELAASGLFEASEGIRGTMAGDGSVVNAYEPPARDRAAYALSDQLERLGLDGRDAYKYARDVMGSSDPTVGFHDSLGLADLTPLGVYFDTDLGVDTMAQGVAQGDLTQIGEGAVQTALGIASLVPGAKAVTKTAAKAVDPMFVRQAEKFTTRNTPVFPADVAAGYRMYLPSPDELATLNRRRKIDPDLLTEAELDYLRRRADADALRAQGVSDAEILDQTGVLNMPVVDASGRELGKRPYATLTDDEFAAMRPNAHAGWTTVEKDLDPRWAKYLPWLQKRNILGWADDKKKVVVINNSRRISKALQDQTKRHEYGHVDLDEAGINPWETGADTPRFDRVLPTAEAPLTRRQMYAYSPGEQLARLSSNEPYDIARLTPLETLNPYLNPNGPLARAKNAVATSLFSDTYKLPFSFRAPTGEGGKLQFPITPEPSRLPEWLASDAYAYIPMDLSKARMYDFEVNPRLPLSAQMTPEMLQDYLDMGRAISP